MRQPLVHDETVDWLGYHSTYSVLTQCSVFACSYSRCPVRVALDFRVLSVKEMKHNKFNIKYLHEGM